MITFTPSERLVFQGPEYLTVSELAEKYRQVNAGSLPGPWMNSRTPYLVNPMDDLSRPEIREVVCCFSPQSGKTQIGWNFMAWAALEQPDTTMLVLPDEKTALRGMKRIMAIFKSAPRLRRLLSPKSYDATRYRLTLRNGMEIFVAWAGSPAELASESVRYVIMDEVDKFPEFSGKEADPMSLARARQTTFPLTRKTLVISTPTTPEGNIWSTLEARADVVSDFEVVCQFCGSHQVMDFDQIKFPDNVRDPRVMRRDKPARYECIHCQAHWTDHQRDRAVRAGRWVRREHIENVQVVGYHLPSWNSPFVSLSDVAADFLDGRHDPAKFMYFITNHKALPWQQTVKAASADVLRSMPRPYQAGMVPAEAYCLTMGVDMQLHGFYYTVFAHTPDRGPDRPRTSWMIEHGTLETWDHLEHMVFKSRWPILDTTGSPTNSTMGIWRAALDTGGGAQAGSDWTRPEEAYLFLRNHARQGRIFGTKGSSHRQQARVKRSQVDKLPGSNKPLIGGLVLYMLDTIGLKDAWFWRLSQDSSQPVYFHQTTTDDFFDQLTSEEKRRDKRGVEKWHQVKRQNHYLDCCILNQALVDASWFPALERLPGQVNIQTCESRAEVKPVKKRTPTVNPYTEGFNPFAR